MSNKNLYIDKLDNFIIIRKIGQGSFGNVLLVQNHYTGLYYALKVLNKIIIVKHNQMEHVKAEKEILFNNNDCPFIVKLY